MALNIERSKLTHQDFKFDDVFQIMEVCGVKYSYLIFDAFGVNGLDKGTHFIFEDNKDGVVVINLRLKDENRIYAESDCIIVQGDSYVNLIKSSERLLYSVLTVL